MVMVMMVMIACIAYLSSVGELGDVEVRCTRAVSQRPISEALQSAKWLVAKFGGNGRQDSPVSVVGQVASCREEGATVYVTNWMIIDFSMNQ